MPIYAYRCTSCGHELEALQKLSDARLTECPACHAAALIKKVSAAGFQLKGSGWYATDFRNSGAKQPAKDAAAKTGDANAGDKANGAATKTDAKSGDGATTESTTTTTKTSGVAGATESKSTTTSTADKTGT
ncbi:MAG TPA: FmdB family zinc ribbon protein [Casimicrobiaceae bacterium]|nr:FmdB family zinc ribbon protein [Casimicrobiaceae bacterium]